MKNLRILLSSLVLPTIVGLKSVEGQLDSPGLENARVDGSWRDDPPATATATATETTTQEIP